MPNRPPRPCTRCRTLGTWPRHGRCPTCEQQKQQARNQDRARRGRYGPQYQRNRKAMLADNPPCHWCGQPATTADHLDGDNPDALTPACLSCNSRRVGGR